MFTLNEIKYIRDTFEKIDNSLEIESNLELSDSIEDKCDELIWQANNENRCLWKFFWDCGRQGSVTGIFKATKYDVENAIGLNVYFGEILGKHSEVTGEFEKHDVELISNNPLDVYIATESGYNPLDYLQDKCSICGDLYTIEEFFDWENRICDSCKEIKTK